MPASASAALREAKTVAGNIAAQVEFETGGDEDEFAPRPDPYRFEVPGWIVSVGDGAVAQVGPSIFRGKAAKAMKATVGAGHLTSVGAISRAVDSSTRNCTPDGSAAGDPLPRSAGPTLRSSLSDAGVSPAITDDTGNDRDCAGEAAMRDVTAERGAR
ncbi:NADH dehydrogenase [Haloferax sp. BAB-2207]|nr:NADH dehydrogenase [Haloferax sp. BAB-2207]